MGRIKVLVMDVDGTLTDGKIYMSEKGELFKAFNIKDGCGIKDILPTIGVFPVVLTARESEILSNRCEELNVKFLYQGIRNKYDKLCEILEEISSASGEECGLDNVAYIGDDLLDLNCMKPVKSGGGLIGCPNDAIEEVKNISDFVAKTNGGEGAVREFIEYIKCNNVID